MACKSFTLWNACANFFVLALHKLCHCHSTRKSIAISAANHGGTTATIECGCELAAGESAKPDQCKLEALKLKSGKALPRRPQSSTRRNVARSGWGIRQKRRKHPRSREG